MQGKQVLEKLLHRLESASLGATSVISWASPVISFGDFSSSRVATLGLNPSNREFVDGHGLELSDDDRRFHTLRSLGIDSWSQIEDQHLERILNSSRDYFQGNPYDSWFKALEKLFVGAGVSYYGMFADACHLDLVPYATASKWGSLGFSERRLLLKESGDALGLLLKGSAVKVLVLNGQSVIENLQSISNCSLIKQSKRDWTLPRKNSAGVEGYSYSGKVSQICGVDLGREIRILGFNHNIQSSFGVTSQVRHGIQRWISSSAQEVFC